MGDWAGWGGAASEVTRAEPRSAPAACIAVLMGGPSAEHDVSLVSGRAIAAALAGRGHPVTGGSSISTGRWWALPDTRARPGHPRDATSTTPRPSGAQGPMSAAAALERIAAADPPTVVFPALHGPFGEDGTVQALLESAGLVYCGSGPAASAVGHGQDAVQARLRLAGAARAALGGGARARLGARRARRAWRSWRRSRRRLPDPRLVIKPARLGSSIGITIVHRPDEPPELEHAVADALRYDDLLLAEPYLDHPRELEVSVVGNGRHDLAVYGPGEIVPGREFYDYIAKYRSGASRTILARADLDPVMREDVRRIAGEAFLAIGLQRLRARRLPARCRTTCCSCRRSTPSPGSRPSASSRACARRAAWTSRTCASASWRIALERAAGRPARRLTRADLP